MSSSKSTTSKGTKAASKADEIIGLTKAIEAVSKERDAFTAAVEKLSEYNEQTLHDMALNIEAKKKEWEQMETDEKAKIDALQTEFQEKKRRREVETETEIKEHRRAAALKILEESNETGIDRDVLAGLKAELQALKDNQEEAIKSAVRAEKAVLIAQHESTIKQAQLSNAAETAQIKAQLEQKDQAIEGLQTQIKDLKGELSAQRDLTRQVAESASQSKINQSFGAMK